MTRYILGYHGTGARLSAEEEARINAAWARWFRDMGSAVVDIGNPVGSSKTLDADGSVSEGGGVQPLTGYSIIEADDFDAAVSLARGCPLLASGGSIQVGETFVAI